jgi:hypothetical protein
MTHEIFISHAPHDRDVADAACRALEARGLACWVAPRDLAPGRPHDEAIAEAIRAARLILLIFSAETEHAPTVQREIEQAGGLPVLGFRVADVAPSPSLHFLVGEWLDALTPPIAPHFDYLGDRALQLLGRTTRGPLMPTLPPRPLPPARRRGPHWLPIALAGLGGLAAIALAAAWVSAGAAGR